MDRPADAERYRQAVLTAPYWICIERARCVTAAHRATGGQHPAARAAAALERCVQDTSVWIHDDEVIAGHQTSRLVGTPLSIERGDADAILELELDGLLARDRQPYHIDPADRRELEREILPYWRGRTVRDLRKQRMDEAGLYVGFGLSPRSIAARLRSLDLRPLASMVRSPVFQPLNALKELREIAYNNPALVMNVFDVQGHMVLGNRNVLPGGFRAIRERAEVRLEGCRREGDEEGQAFLGGVIRSCEAIRELAARYAAAARQRADGCGDGARRRELRAMAERCDRVPYLPPRDFREAVQALWLTQVGAMLAYGMTGIFAVGRADLQLAPYYEADRARGAIEPDEAVELLSELLVKLSSNVLLLPTAGKSTGSELGADSMAVTVGGLGRDGEDGTRELSYRFLDAVRAVEGLGNTFTIRVSERSPRSWLDAAAETLRVTSGPALFNDERTVEALIGCGYSEEDARDYAVVGCVEPTSDGNTFGCTSGNDISLVGALEMTLLRGHLRIIGRRVGPDTGDPLAFAGFDEFMDAYRRQVRFMVDTVAAGVEIKDRVYASTLHNPYVSATLDGCVDAARDMTCGGARYDFASISARGLGTAADSLAAIRTAVYERGRYSMAELLAALARNFAGHEPMRQYLAHRPPRYGSDDPAVDSLAAELVEFFCDEVSSRKSDRGGPYRPGFFSYGMHVLEGALLGATPDGRRSGEPISNSLSPSNGSERAGPTGVFNSVAGLPHDRVSNGSALNIKLLPSLLAGDRGRDNFVALVRGYFDRGGMEVQCNVVDDATLRDAQRHPDRYRGLVVRVSGYSAFFTDLGPAIQDEIIARTTFGSL